VNDVDAGRVADELRIRNLVARLTHLADSGTEDQLEEYLSIFTEDALWVVMGGLAGGTSLAAQERRGRDEILEGVRERRAAGIQGPGTNTKHGITTMMVAFESDDKAIARCNWVYYVDTNTDAPRLAAMGEYRNTFVRTSQGWQLACRELIPG
jgi:3-phenylpropionate/cinnamic acid dioxygenase small subunit